MKLIKEIVILNPPTKYERVYKNPKVDKNGKQVNSQVFYLTANLFYADRTSYHVTTKIFDECKKFLVSHLKGIPQLSKLNLEIEYHSPKHIDLDNKCYFWRKLLLDVLKTPSNRQLDNAYKRKKQIISTYTIDDDNTKTHTKYSEEYFNGEHKMIIRMYGVEKDVQKTLDL